MAIDWVAGVLMPTIGVFGEPATYLPQSGGRFDVVGVFDQAYSSPSLLGDEPSVNSVRPILGIVVADFPAWTGGPKKNDKVLIRSVGLTYVVSEVRPDGHGHAVLELKKSGL